MSQPGASAQGETATNSSSTVAVPLPGASALVETGTNQRKGFWKCGRKTKKGIIKCTLCQSNQWPDNADGITSVKSSSMSESDPITIEGSFDCQTNDFRFLLECVKHNLQFVGYREGTTEKSPKKSAAQLYSSLCSLIGKPDASLGPDLKNHFWTDSNHDDRTGDWVKKCVRFTIIDTIGQGEARTKDEWEEVLKPQLNGIPGPK